MGRFLRCSSLASITIPEGVTSIGDGAFSDCSSLVSITIPEGVTSIGDGAFLRCSSLASIDVDYGNSEYSSEAGVLFNKDKTTLIQHPIGVKTTSYEIPEGVTSMGDGAFYGCSSLASITIPEGVKSIEDRAFYGCSSLASITIPEGVTSIGVGAFSNCNSLASITIPEGVKSIGNAALYGCSSLTDISYNGSKAEWEGIEGIDDARIPETAIIHFAIGVTLDGNYITFDQMPIIEDGRTLVPLRAIFEALGAEVNWIAEESKVVATKDSTTVSIKIGENKILVNGEEKTLDVPAKIINGRTLVPVRAISEAFNCNVSWDGEARTVIITK